MTVVPASYSPVWTDFVGVSDVVSPVDQQGEVLRQTLLRFYMPPCIFMRNAFILKSYKISKSYLQKPQHVCLNSIVKRLNGPITVYISVRFSLQRKLILDFKKAKLNFLSSFVKSIVVQLHSLQVYYPLISIKLSINNNNHVFILFLYMFLYIYIKEMCSTFIFIHSYFNHCPLCFPTQKQGLQILSGNITEGGGRHLPRANSLCNQFNNMIISLI